MNTADLSLAEWLYLLENRHADEIQLGLDRIKRVANCLGLLTPRPQIITVAGTNGKGSTVAALEAIYRIAGYQVASYTSPHLIHFNERIRVNLEPITDKALCAAFRVIETAREATHLTYFEMATLAALWHFKQCRLDVIILEVGIGGRLDATNIIDSDLAIITTIDFDHQAYLGDTLDAIGYEKAGILRPNTPFIYSDSIPPDSIMEQSCLLNAPRINYTLNTTSDSLKIRHEALFEKQPSGSGTQNAPSSTETLIALNLPQINSKAAAAAVMASVFLNNVLPVSFTQLNQAMSNVFIPGRQQWIDGKVSTLFDVAHNPQAARLLADLINNRLKKYNEGHDTQVHAVFSCLNDKDLRGIIQPMQSCVDFWYPTVLSSKRAVTEFDLKSAFESENLSISQVYKDPITAYLQAMQRAKPGDLIVVFGSFLTVGAIMGTYCNKLEELQ